MPANVLPEAYWWAKALILLELKAELVAELVKRDEGEFEEDEELAKKDERELEDDELKFRKEEREEEETLLLATLAKLLVELPIVAVRLHPISG